MRYKILLAPNSSITVQALRDKYIATFGDACYVSVNDTFDCFYQKWQDACADAVKIGEVSGNAPYDKGYTCKPDGVGNYTLQIGPDVANVTYITYQTAPRQTPDTDIMGVPTGVNGPYRDLPDPAGVAPGNLFNVNSGVSDGDGGVLTQAGYMLQVNKNANDGGILSDLKGYTWPCPGEDGGVTLCTEVDFLDPDAGPTQANVHHVVPKKDKRCCPWGTNAYKNAAVISRTLNLHLSNDNPTVKEVMQLNDPTKAYPP